MTVGRRYFTYGALAGILSATAIWQHIHIRALRFATAGAMVTATERKELVTEIAVLRRREATFRPAERLDPKVIRSGRLKLPPRLYSKERFFSPAALVPSTQWKNVGTGTPAASFETLLYAYDNFDVDAWTSATHFSNDAQAKADALFEQLPRSEQEEFQTPERLVGYLAVEAVSGIVGAAVVGESTDPSGGEVLRTEALMSDGRVRVKDESYENFGGSWQTILRGDVLNQYLDLATRRAAQGERY